MDLITRKQALMAGACIAFLLGGTPVQVFASNATAPVEASAPTQKVVGTVVDQSGDPIIGANVLVKGTRNGTITDFDGRFTIEAPSGAILVVSYIGYVQQEVKVTGDKLTIQLAEDSKSLEEVVVVGYGTMKKKLVTGATVQVKGDDIAKLNTTNALEAMQSQTPGVQITQSSSQPGKGYKVYIRGVGTTGDSAPLYVIDGVAGGNLDGINPNDIESIDILKDAASAAIYGSTALSSLQQSRVRLVSWKSHITVLWVGLTPTSVHSFLMLSSIWQSLASTILTLLAMRSTGVAMFLRISLLRYRAVGLVLTGGANSRTRTPCSRIIL